MKSYARVHGQPSENDKGYVSISYEKHVTELQREAFKNCAHFYRLIILCSFRAGASYFRLVRPLRARKCEQARGVWGHAPPGKFLKLGTLRSLLRPCLGQKKLLEL